MRRSRPTPLFYRHRAPRPLPPTRGDLYPQHADSCPDPLNEDAGRRSRTRILSDPTAGPGERSIRDRRLTVDPPALVDRKRTATLRSSIYTCSTIGRASAKTPGSRQKGAEDLLGADPIRTAGSQAQVLHSPRSLYCVAERLNTWSDVVGKRQCLRAFSDPRGLVTHRYNPHAATQVLGCRGHTTTDHCITEGRDPNRQSTKADETAPPPSRADLREGPHVVHHTVSMTTTRQRSR